MFSPLYQMSGDVFRDQTCEFFFLCDYFLISYASGWKIAVEESNPSIIVKPSINIGAMSL